jgi:hypothetical protein
MTVSWGRRGRTASSQYAALHLVVLGTSKDMVNTFTIGQPRLSCVDNAQYLH